MIERLIRLKVQYPFCKIKKNGPRDVPVHFVRKKTRDLQLHFNTSMNIDNTNVVVPFMTNRRKFHLGGVSCNG